MLRTRGNSLTWLGHAAFRITTPTGKVVLIDPWIASNPSCPAELKKLERVDTMLITHGHFDHIADAVELGKKFKPQIVGDLRNWPMAGIQRRAERAGDEQGRHPTSG